MNKNKNIDDKRRNGKSDDNTSQKASLDKKNHLVRLFVDRENMYNYIDKTRKISLTTYKSVLEFVKINKLLVYGGYGLHVYFRNIIGEGIYMESGTPDIDILHNIEDIDNLYNKFVEFMSTNEKIDSSEIIFNKSSRAYIASIYIHGEKIFTIRLYNKDIYESISTIIIDDFKILNIHTMLSIAYSLLSTIHSIIEGKYISASLERIKLYKKCLDKNLESPNSDISNISDVKNFIGNINKLQKIDLSNELGGIFGNKKLYFGGERAYNIYFQKQTNSNTRYDILLHESSIETEKILVDYGYKLKQRIPGSLWIRKLPTYIFIKANEPDIYLYDSSISDFGVFDKTNIISLLSLAANFPEYIDPITKVIVEYNEKDFEGLYALFTGTDKKGFSISFDTHIAISTETGINYVNYINGVEYLEAFIEKIKVYENIDIE